MSRTSGEGGRPHHRRSSPTGSAPPTGPGRSRRAKPVAVAVAVARWRLTVPALLMAALGFSAVVVGGLGQPHPLDAGSSAEVDSPPRTPAATGSSPGLAVALGARVDADGDGHPDTGAGGGAGGKGRGAGTPSGTRTGTSSTSAAGRGQPDTGTGTGTAGTTAAGPSAAVMACASARAGTLSIEEQAGQVVMVGVPITDARTAIDLVARSRLGGVFLAGRSTQAASDLRGDLSAVQEAARRDVGIAVHIGVDQEGGQVQALSGPGFEKIPNAVEQGNWDASTLRDRTAGWARALAGAGVTLDLAPVADTVAPGTARANPPIGVSQRNFDTDPGGVAAALRVAIPAMQDGGLLATAKHFPGLGRVHANTDTSTDAVDDVAGPSDPNLAPFRAAISADTAAVMVSLARYPRLDPTTPAIFSRPIVTGLLREQLGFRGLVMSDDLGAAVAVGSVPVGERAVRFVAAGGDLALSVRGADGVTMTAALAAEAHRAPAFAHRLTEAATAVLASKIRTGLLPCDGVR
ncbi:glycoside hydrolase family 3 N-terminal domain-containing protein [Frankia sp. R82]|uniref:glycoside hydrolase family 3 N-terminal domain-containing protein n=1 Tax=Frankia sp. R82 TaxID=2950553 RepID=UPI0020445049|nr:glycoside hydrolase family 3 N-terminal domain-containing protein [Frankia sp. R82]MCM3885619.1 hypothetical protein [Frankia sp. R82]